jgi:hypothetical protein
MGTIWPGGIFGISSEGAGVVAELGPVADVSGACGGGGGKGAIPDLELLVQKMSIWVEVVLGLADRALAMD